MTRKATERTGAAPGPAAVNLQRFITDKGFSIRDASKAVGVTHPALIAWLEGEAMPSAIHRKKIDAWTSGAVSEESWLTDAELEAIAAVKPAPDPVEESGPASEPKPAGEKGDAA